MHATVFFSKSIKLVRFRKPLQRKILLTIVVRLFFFIVDRLDANLLVVPDGMLWLVIEAVKQKIHSLLISLLA